MSIYGLLIDPPLAGSVNMGRDEALLAHAGSTPGTLILRLYAWSTPTVSLGYFQNYDELLRLETPAGALPAVRRTTGGGAILHDQEITYSLAVSAADPLVRGNSNNLYRVAHAAIIQAVGAGARLFGDGCDSCGESARRGPFFCFARRHPLDVVIDDPVSSAATAKLAGSAQRRTPTAILQHGSLMLENRYPQHPTATWASLAGRTICFSEAAERLAVAFERVLGTTFEPMGWPQAVLATAAEIQRRYESEAWMVHRRRDLPTVPVDKNGVAT